MTGHRYSHVVVFVGVIGVLTRVLPQESDLPSEMLGKVPKFSLSPILLANVLANKFGLRTKLFFPVIFNVILPDDICPVQNGLYTAPTPQLLLAVVYTELRGTENGS